VVWNGTNSPHQSVLSPTTLSAIGEMMSVPCPRSTIRLHSRLRTAYAPTGAHAHVSAHEKQGDRAAEIAYQRAVNLL